MITEFNGYKFNKTETKFVNEKLWYSQPDDFDDVTFVSNRFTGVTAKVPVLARYIYDWIIEWSNQYEMTSRSRAGSSVKEFDMARSLFRKLWPTEYMDLLD